MSNTEYKCSRCGQLKHIDELNGYDPMTHDYSKAYCRRLADCNSGEADKIVRRINTECDDRYYVKELERQNMQSRNEE